MKKHTKWFAAGCITQTFGLSYLLIRHNYGTDEAPTFYILSIVCIIVGMLHFAISIEFTKNELTGGEIDD